MKKKLSLLLVMVMMLSMVLPVFAAEDGSITILNPEPEVNYYVYKIFDATYADQNGVDVAAYTIDNDSDWLSVVGASGLFTITDVAGKNFKNVEKVAGKTDVEIINWLKTVDVPTAATELATLSVENNSADVPYGYYIITDSKLGSADNRVVTVDNVKGNIDILDKNQKPGWDHPTPDEDDSDVGKNISAINGDGPWKKEDNQQMGENVYFKIGAFVPMYNGENKVKTYTFTDAVPAGLSVDTLDVNVELFDNAGAAFSLDQTTDYEVTRGDDDEIIVTLNANDIVNYPTHGKLVISYTALVNKDAVYANINTVEMSWTEIGPSGDEVDEELEDSSSTTTYVYGFELGKYAGKYDEEGNPVIDTTVADLVAEFKLYSDAQGNDEVKVVQVTDSTGEFVPDKYRVAVGNEDGVVIEAGNVTIFGLDAKSYWLKETKAPEGYNALTGFRVVDLSAVTGNGGYLTGEVEILNFTGLELPGTGGIGTTIFYVVGGMMMLGAAVLLVAKKRVSAE